MAKQMTTSGREDMISNLPDPVLCHILSFLPSKQAASTSILSPRWRYLFASLSNLDIDDSNMRTRTRIRNFFNFMDKLLLSHDRTTIEKLGLRISNDSSRVHSWLSGVLLGRGLQQLDLNINYAYVSSLPAALFTCKTLVVLKLDIMHFVLNVPNDVCLPNLKTLHLSNIKFSNDDSVQHLISGSIMLEDFVLNFCSLKNIIQLNICHPFLKRFTMNHRSYEDLKELHKNNCWFVIDAPSLVYLKYWDNIAAGYSLVNLHSLMEAEIAFDQVSNNESPQTCEHVTTKFLRGIANAKSLALSSPFMKLFSCRKELLPPVFEKLVELKILLNPGHLFEQKIAYILLNISMPTLESLTLPHQIILRYVLEKACLLSKLKRVEISYFFKGNKLEEIKYFLKNATALEKLTIKTLDFYDRIFDEQEKSEMAKELLASQWKSRNCCILVL